MISTTAWIVVADGARARVAMSKGPREPLETAREREFGVPHAPTRAFVSDRPGHYSELGPTRRAIAVRPPDLRRFSRAAWRTAPFLRRLPAGAALPAE